MTKQRTLKTKRNLVIIIQGPMNCITQELIAITLTTVCPIGNRYKWRCIKNILYYATSCMSTICKKDLLLQ